MGRQGSAKALSPVRFRPSPPTSYLRQNTSAGKTSENFEKSLNFINKVSQIAEDENHHPDLKFGWGYANIIISTHAINGLAESDFVLAAKIDEVSV